MTPSQGPFENTSSDDYPVIIKNCRSHWNPPDKDYAAAIDVVWLARLPIFLFRELKWLVAKVASIDELLRSADPLSDDALAYLVKYQEEDDRLDYKLSVDGSSEKEWLSLTKDISAFANTFGGYLLVGVRNNDRSPVGLDTAVATTLSDSNNIQQKVNRYLEPQIGTLRTKQFTFEGKLLVGIFIPRSSDCTHVISKDGAFEHPSGGKVTLLRKGTVYVRRSGGNHLADSRDIDQLLNRRLDYFRESLLAKIAKVVEAPADGEVFVLSRDPADKAGKRFIIRDSPDSIPIKGLSFTVAPEAEEERIAAWVLISGQNPLAIPPDSEMWNWYLKRHELHMSAEHRLAVAQFFLWREMPKFFWLKGLRTQDIQKAILHCANHRPPGAMLTPMFEVAGMLGQTFYRKLSSAVGSDINRLAPSMRHCPTDMRANICSGLVGRGTDRIADLVEKLEQELDSIAAAGMSLDKGSLPTAQKARANKLDCCLYAQDDEYA